MLNGRFDSVISTMVGTASVILGVVVAGRALNSQLAMNLQQLPVLGFVIPPMRAVVNQVYDISSSD